MLALGGPLLGWALTGCTTSSPTVSGRGTTPAPARGASVPASPSGPPTTALQTAVAEQSLADLSAAILTGPHRISLSRGQRSFLTWLGPVHAEHAVALVAPDPGSRPTTAAASPPAGAAPSVARLSLAASLALLAKEEAAQATRLRRTAVTLSGSAALVYGAIAVAGAGHAGALPDGAAVVPLGPHRPLAVVSDVVAQQQLVEQLHAVVYGYQLAIGRLGAVGKTRDRAVADLRDHRVLLARLSDRLVTRGAEVPPGEAAYTPSVTVRDAASAQTLLRRVETALLPFCGLWLAAAATGADRTEALSALAATARTARSWGAPLRAWPGLSD